jgi:hypothetical protein
VRQIVINIWGETNLAGGFGLLRAHNLTGIGIPPVLFDFVEYEAEGWTEWFMACRVWLPGIEGTQSAGFAPASFATGFLWDDDGRIVDLDGFFSYTEEIILRAVDRFEAGGTLGYLSGLSVGFQSVVIHLVVDGYAWHHTTQELAAPFRRVLSYVLESAPRFPANSDLLMEIDPGQNLSSVANVLNDTQVVMVGAANMGRPDRVLAANADMPAWVTFDPVTRAFTGVPPAGVTGDIVFQVVASNARGTDAATVTVRVSSVFGVNVSVVGEGTATAAPNTDVLAGTTVTVTATPADWHMVGSITVNGTPITGTTFPMPADVANVVVTFVPNPVYQHDVNVTVIGNGEATAAPDTDVLRGTTVAVTATPDDWHMVSTITVNGTPITGTTFEMPNETANVVVTFVPDPAYQHDVNVSVVGEGTRSEERRVGKECTR